MNIVLLAPRVWNTIFVDQARALARLGHRVTVYTEDRQGTSGRDFLVRREEGVEYWIIHDAQRNSRTWLLDRLCKPWLGRRFFTSASAVARFLRAQADADLVLVEGDWVGIFVAMARRPAVRWVVTIHDTLNLPIRLDYAGRRVDRLHAWLKMWVLRRADVVRANSAVTRDVLVEAGCAPGKVVVVPLHLPARMFAPTGEDLAARRDRCAAALRARYGLPADARTLMTMSRITPVKGLELAVEALAHSGDPRLHLLICGGDRSIAGMGSYLDRLRALAREHGVGDRLVACGDVPVDQVQDHLAGADLHVAPSLLDTFNLAVAEAALVGTRSLMSDKVGAAPWIAELGGGEILPGRDAVQWAARIDALLTNGWDDGAGLARRCAERFSPERIARELLEAVIPAHSG